MIIAIDFDGTVVEHKYPEIGELKPKAKEVINKLVDKGHYIIIWTCRYVKKDLEDMLDFLIANEIKFHNVNMNYPNLDFKPIPKVYANIYIDDRNIFCEDVNWDKIELYLTSKNIL
jgi:hydroxymethylpyrimidine pyrophosphatase-like HAD family hydrolase